MCLHLRPLKLSLGLECLESALGSAGNKVQQTESSAFLFKSKGWLKTEFYTNNVLLSSSLVTEDLSISAVPFKKKSKVTLMPQPALCSCYSPLEIKAAV